MCPKAGQQEIVNMAMCVVRDGRINEVNAGIRKPTGMHSSLMHALALQKALYLQKALQKAP